MGDNGRIDLGADDGWLMVSIGEGESRTEARIDVFATNDLFFDHHAKNEKADEATYSRGLVEIVAGLGLGSVSQAMALRFRAAIKDKVKEIQGRFFSAPASPGSSPASTPAA